MTAVFGWSHAVFFLEVSSEMAVVRQACLHTDLFDGFMCVGQQIGGPFETQIAEVGEWRLSGLALKQLLKMRYRQTKNACHFSDRPIVIQIFR